MRKLLLIVLVPLVLASCLYATPSIQAGVSAVYGNYIGSESFADGLDDIGNYSFGAEFRFNPFGFISVVLPATFGFDSSLMTINAYPSVNLNIGITKLVDVAAGVGVAFSFMNNDGDWTVNNLPLDEFSDAFMNANLFYRGAVTFNLGFIGLGLGANIPSKGSFNDFDAVPDWERTAITASVLLNFF